MSKKLRSRVACLGHKVDILTRQIVHPQWPEFALPFDTYPGVDNLRIVRLPAGPQEFLPKELLWSPLVRDWVPNILKFYHQESGGLPDAMTAHYADEGISGVLIEDETNVPFTFTAHSLGAQKMDKLEASPENLAQIDEQFHFKYRIFAERLSMNRAGINITSTRQERFEQYAHPTYHGAVDVNNDRRFAVIPPGVDFAVFGSDARSPNEKATYQLVEERLARDITDSRRNLPAIMAASRLAPKKNILGLVQAYAQSQTLQEKANLVLITGGLDDPLREQANNDLAEQAVLAPIREVVRSNDLWGKISAFGSTGQPMLAAIYRFMAGGRSVFALTSLYEPFGLAPLEAAAGLPVVATKNGGPSESLKQGDKEYGVLVDPEDPADIARGLERLLCDENQWKLAQVGQQRVLKSYTSNTAQNYLSVIEQVVSSAKAGHQAQLLPIPPYFRNPQANNDISLKELKQTYFNTSV